ncbi:phosphotransferase family protein [Streptomyces collinus]|uniref:phosphotransferase family protein n=1 Tax=Streptomyces collinus TaxID=42684 RepID=UPI003661AFBE
MSAVKVLTEALVVALDRGELAGAGLDGSLAEPTCQAATNAVDVLLDRVPTAVVNPRGPGRPRPAHGSGGPLMTLPITAPEDTVPLTAHLVRRGLAAAGSELRVRPLTGGVSNDVLWVTGPGVDVVVKRALSRLRVAETWTADTGRLDTEGRALGLAARLTPESVPKVHDLSDGYLVIERAPLTWHTWRDDLLAGFVNLTVAERLGRVLGTWQRLTAEDPALLADFADRAVFTQLRVDPFHRTIRERHPDLAGPVDETIAVMARTSACLVHGDYTPKNVLADPAGAGLWVIDWEVAHVGDPTFDPAWIIGHLLLKTLNEPRYAASYAEAARMFLAALVAETSSVHSLDPAQLVRQTACLVLARVDGKSPAGYLGPEARRRARTLGRALLQDPPASVSDAWEKLS